MKAIYVCVAAIQYLKAVQLTLRFAVACLTSCGGGVIVMLFGSAGRELLFLLASSFSAEVPGLTATGES